MKLDEAIGIAIQALKDRTAANYGYDYCARQVAHRWAARETSDHFVRDAKTSEYYSLFEEAGWVLCLRGILRPGVNNHQGQATTEGGYSLTAGGANCLQTLDGTNAVVYQSSALLETFAGYADRFGSGFVQRVAEAVKCRDAGAWLGSCVMSGAAAEAALIATAVNKTGDEKSVLKTYRSAHGRREIVNLIANDSKAYIREQLQTFAGIISIWRDEAGHGTDTTISTANADESLRQLLHMCQWVDKEWDVLTR